MDPFLTPTLLSLFLHYFQPSGSLPPAPRPPLRNERVVDVTEPSEGRLTIRTTEVVHSSFPKGAVRVPVLEVEAEATCDADTEISSMELQRRGMGDRTDIQLVYAMRGTQRISRARSIANRDGSVQIRFRPALKIAACETENMTIMVDISPVAAVSGQHQITLQNAAHVQTDALVTLERERSKAALGTVTPYDTGALSVRYKDVGRIRYGHRRILGRIALTADGEDDQAVYEMTLTNDGTARSNDLTSLYIQSGADRVTQLVPRLMGKSARFVFDPPLIVGKNNTRSLVVRGNVKTGRRRTIKLLVEEPGDLVVRKVGRSTIGQ